MQTLVSFLVSRFERPICATYFISNTSFVCVVVNLIKIIFSILQNGIRVVRKEYSNDSNIKVVKCVL